MTARIARLPRVPAADVALPLVTVGIGDETRWRQVEGILLAAAGKTEGVLREPAPFAWHQSLGDFRATCEPSVFIGDALAAGPLRTALPRNVNDGSNESGLQGMTPTCEGDPRGPKRVNRGDRHLPPARVPDAPPADA